MPTKTEILREDPFKLDVLTSLGFKRFRCIRCGSNFWSIAERKTCGDPPCGGYEFLFYRRPDKSLEHVRESFISWFERHDHQRVSRYPVVARWKPDTFYTGASIYCFQPWVLSGEAEPPGNPLVISQPSFRAVDLENIGLGTSRHMSVFEMMAHHSFEMFPGKTYWKEETVSLCLEWLKHIGIDHERVVLKESWWEGGGNAGPCFEVILEGNEIATLVFMEYSGPINGSYKKMKGRVVDTGYGLERFAWYFSSEPTPYHSSYPDVISVLERECGTTKEILFHFVPHIPLGLETAIKKTEEAGFARDEIEKSVSAYHKIFQIADHAKAVGLILSDGVVPSNAAEGYIPRLLIRRSLRHLSKLGLDIDFTDIVRLHYKDLPETVLKMIEIEKEKYRKMKERGKRIVKKILAGRKITLEVLTELYESHGLLPGDVEEILGIELPVKDAETVMAVKKSEPRKKPAVVPDLPPSEFVRDVTELESRVIAVTEKGIVLERTCFYPRSGGQEPDRGFITWDGKSSEVVDVEKTGNSIIHVLSGEKPPAGAKVKCRIDENRRKLLSIHHTATHILNYSCRKVFGDHVWQYSAFKDVDRARLDITHFEKPTGSEIETVENLANEIIRSNLDVAVKELPRTEAERKYGFRLYQGGAVPGKRIRVVSIDEIEHEACGGTHVSSTSEVKRIFVKRVEKVQDGVIRFTFMAGEPAVEYMKRWERVVKKCSGLLNVEPEQLCEKIKEMLKSKKKKKPAKIPDLSSEFTSMNGIKLLVRLIDENEQTMKEISRKLSTDNTIIVLANRSSKLFISCGRKTRIDASDLMKKIVSDLGGKGGGSETVAFGFIEKPDIEKIKKIVEESTCSKK
ncbi:MAG: alanine--tRNA ligase [Candidatus Micrarchaeota archaeon]|nr:alanine--tRNA ligase [Candidatus Micrarchaeota archaeon]